MSIKEVISKEQEEILMLILSEYLTVKQIARRRKTSVQSVYKTIRKLKAKGLLQGTNKRGLKFSMHSDPIYKGGLKQVRLHGLEFNIGIISKNEKYYQVRQQKNKLIYEGNTIRLYNDSIEVYSHKDFYSDEVEQSLKDSEAYFNLFFVKLEQLLGITILKGINTRIKQVKAHYSLTNNDLAKDYNKKKIRLYVKSDIDGKLRFTIDNSYNLHEFEGLHPETSKPDIEKVKRVFNEYASEKAYTPFEIQKVVAELAQSQLNTSRQIEILLNLLVPSDNTNGKHNHSDNRPKYIG